MQSIEEHVHHLYWDHDINCARTMLMYLAAYFKVPLKDQTLHAAIGMHGGGGFRAQCGLVEGALMFLGIYFAQKGLSDASISKLCFTYAQAFTVTFSSLECRVLRPGGFQETDPPHLCEGLTVRAIAFTRDFIEDFSRATKPVD
jgi:hypothetical protein